MKHKTNGHGELKYIPRRLIKPNPEQPRKEQSDLSELRASIQLHGIIEPLVVRYAPQGFSKEESYILVAGERRFRASEGIVNELPCVIRDVNENTAFELAWTENELRTQMTRRDAALALRGIMKARKITSKRDLARKTGYSQGFIENCLLYDELPPDLQQLVDRRPDTISHAKEIKKVKSLETRKHLIDETLEGASVPAIKEKVELYTHSIKPKAPAHITQLPSINYDSFLQNARRNIEHVIKDLKGIDPPATTKRKVKAHIKVIKEAVSKLEKELQDE